MKKNLSKTRKGSTAGTIISYILLSSVLIIILLPMLWGLTASFSPLSKVFAYTIPFSWKALVPVHFTLEAYSDLFIAGFARAIKNSFILSISVTVTGVLISAMAGFGFAQFSFPGKSLLFIFVLFTFMIPVEVMIIPLYILVEKFGWLNTWRGLLIPSFANSMAIFLFRQFFLDMPKDIIDAAKIDSAGWARIFLQIVLPLSKPVIVSAALIIFIKQWSSFFWPLVIAPKAAMRVIQVALSFTITEHGMMWNQLMAGSMLAAIIPILIMFPFQKYYVQGLVGSGLKG